MVIENINDNINNLEILHISEKEIDITINNNDIADDQNIILRMIRKLLSITKLYLS